MGLQISSDNLQITGSMRFLVEQKLKAFLSHVEKQEREQVNIRVVLNKAQEPEKFLVKVEAKIAGKNYFGDDADYTLESALIKAVEEVNKQYIKDKERLKQRDWSKNRDLKRYQEDKLNGNRE